MSEDKKGTTTVEDYITPESLEFDYVEETMSSTIGKIAGALAKAQSQMVMVEAKSTNPFFNSDNLCLLVSNPITFLSRD